MDKLFTGTIVTLTVIIGAILMSTRTSADGVTDFIDTATIGVPVSCSISSTTDTAHTAIIPNGIYSGTELYPNGIGKTTIATFCNDSDGFAIYAIGFTGDQYSGEDHTKLIGVNTNHKISTGTATSGSTSNWAMKLTKETDSTKSYNPANLTITNGYDNYSAVPDTYTKVANYTSATDNTLGSVLSTTYAVYMSGTQTADTYFGKVKYTLVHPATEVPVQPQTSAASQICYYANASTAVGTMGCQTIGTTDGTTSTSATLLASNFSRAGYGFAGWSDSFDYATNSNAKFYGPQEYIEFTEGQYSGVNEGLSLYAVWIKSAGSLQDSTKVAELCGTGGTGGTLTTTPTDGTASLSSVSALTDQRDNETYAIAKLADGKCWMIENLRLEHTNSDNSTGSLAQGYGTSITYGNFSGLAEPETANFTGNYDSATEPTEPNSLYYAGTQSGTATININQIDYAAFRMPRYNRNNHQTNSADRPQNPTVNTATNSTTKASMYSYGNYYTWSAAIANTNYYDSYTATDADGKTSETVNTSICPKGWRLPRGGNKTRIEGGTSDWYILSLATVGSAPANYSSSPQPYWFDDSNTEGTDASNSMRSYPNNFLYSGAFNSSTSFGSRGYYWSSTTGSESNGNSQRIGSSYVYPSTYGYGKFYGFSIRCLVDS